MRYWLFCWFMCFMGLAHGQNIERIYEIRDDNSGMVKSKTNRQTDGYRASSYIYAVEDSLRKLRFEDVLTKDFYKQMHLMETGARKRFVLNRVYWYRMAITNQNPNGDIEFALELSYAGIQDYRVLHKGNLIKKMAGSDIPASQRDWYGRYNSILLRIPYRDTVWVVGKMENKIYTHPSLDALLTPENAHMAFYLENISSSLFFVGALLIMFAYNFCYFFIVRDRAYLYYSLYVLITSHLVASSYLSNYLLEKEYPEVRFFLSASPILPTIFYLLFTVNFFDTDKLQPKLYRYLSVWLLIRIVIAIIYFYLNYHITNNTKTIVIAWVSALDMLWGVWLVVTNRKRQKIMTSYILLGVICLTVPIFLFALRGYLPESLRFDKLELVRMGVMAEVVLFGLGLGYRSFLLKQEKISAQLAFIGQLEENERLIKEQKVVLEQTVEERTAELKDRNKELASSLKIIKRQHEDILSSINYARRIQFALLAPKESIQAHLPDFMLFYLPKDIVSGDFYWFSAKQESLFLVAADCTGHGVPGAFMTMIGSSLLEQIINKDRLCSPAQILMELDKRLLKTLQQQGINTEAVNDGMDISLLRIDIEARHVVWAGAKRPLWVFEKGAITPTEHKGSKYPIGSTQFKEKAFTEKELFLQAGDVVYAFTDGYADQFGAAGKMTIRRFRDFLSGITALSFEEQEKALEENLAHWRGESGQTDDVLLLGVRF